MFLSYTIYLKYFVPVLYGMAPKKKVQITLIVSCEAYLDWPSKGAEVGRFERFVLLFLTFVCKVFCFCFWDSNFLEFLRLTTKNSRNELSSCSHFL